MKRKSKENEKRKKTENELHTKLHFIVNIMKKKKKKKNYICYFCVSCSVNEGSKMKVKRIK